MSLFSFHRQGLDFETSFEERPQHRSPPIWHHLKTILFPYRFQIFLSVLVLLWASLSLLGLGMGVRFIVDRVLQQQDGSSFIMDVLVVLTFLVSMLVSANYVRLSLVAWLTEQVIASLRITLWTTPI